MGKLSETEQQALEAQIVSELKECCIFALHFAYSVRGTW